MKTIIGYVRAYFQQINRKVLVSTLLLCALFIFINYQYGIESRLRAIDTMPLRIAGYRPAGTIPGLCLWQTAETATERALPSRGHWMLLA